LFAREKPPQASGATPAQTAADVPADPEAQQRLAVWFSNASVTDGRVGWLDGKSGHHHEAQVTQLTLDAPPGDAAQLTGSVVYQGRTINLTGRAVPTELADSGPGSGPWPVSLKLETGDASLTVDGQIEHPSAARGYTLTIDAEVPNPSIFAPWLPGLPLASLKSVTAHAEVSDGDGPDPTVSAARVKVESVDLGMFGKGAKLENLTIGAQGDAPIKVATGVTRDGFDSGITGTIGDLHWFNAGGRGPISVDLEWNAASARASVRGTIKAPTQFAGFDLDVAADVPKPLQIMNDAPPDLRSVAFHTKLTDAPGPVPFQLTSNAGDLTGALSVSRLSKPAGAAFLVEGGVSSQRLDLDMLLARPPGGAVTTPEPSSGGVAAATDKLLIPDTKLPFGLLRALDANIKLGFADVRFDGVDIRKIDSVAAIKDGQLRVDPFTIAAPDQRMSGTLVADAAQTPPMVHLTVNAPALAVQPLLAALGLPQVASGTAQVQADLTGTGESPRAIAASLNGWAGVALEGGQLDTKMMNAWLDRVQPLQFSGPDVTELRCFALRADLKSGIATIEPVALNTPALIVDGDGDVDLGRETLALQVRPRAKIGGTGIAVPVRVSGPLREPSAKIDISAKGIGHGLSGLLLGGKDVMGTGGDPCPAALARAREAVPPAAGKP
jgi:hypothetical protein